MGNSGSLNTDHFVCLTAKQRKIITLTPQIKKQACQHRINNDFCTNTWGNKDNGDHLHIPSNQLVVEKCNK